MTWDLDSLRRNDRGAWQAAFAYLWKLLLPIIRKKVFSVHDAEDLTSKSITILSKKLDGLRDNRHMIAMSIKIARWQVSHYLRDNVAGIRDVTKEVNLDSIGDISSEMPDPTRMLEADEVLNSLSKEDRALMESVFYDGCTSEEAGKRFGMNASTVRGRIAKILTLLRKRRAS